MRYVTMFQKDQAASGCRQLERLIMKSSRNPRSFWILLMGLSLQWSIAGCGGRGLYQVKGQVVYKDGSDVSVLARGLVVFDPADPEMPKVSARGEIQKDGSFRMSTYTEGDGVLPGNYRVAVTPPPFFKKTRDDIPPRLLDERFLDFATSELVLNVTGSITDYTVTVQKP
jgi:hypothetical protein